MAVETDAFTGGIAPGGLRTKNDIRILLCYLLSSVGAPIRRDDIIRIMQENSLCNYFEVTEALSDLLQKGAIQRDPQEDSLLTAGPMAREIAEQLTGTIPLSVRDKAVSAALNLLAQAKREKEARKNQHVMEVKEIRLSLNIDVADFQTKAKHAAKFLQAGNKVKVSIRFRGREMGHPEIGLDTMKRFAEVCAEHG